MYKISKDYTMYKQLRYLKTTKSKQLVSKNHVIYTQLASKNRAI